MQYQIDQNSPLTVTGTLKQNLLPLNNNAEKTKAAIFAALIRFFLPTQSVTLFCFFQSAAFWICRA
jgi:hypothetical protein